MSPIPYRLYSLHLMRKIAIFLHPRPYIRLGAYLYHRQEGQVNFGNLWDFRTVGSLRYQW